MPAVRLDRKLTDLLEGYAQPIRGILSDYDNLMQATRGKKFVLLGEASHGTAEFYRVRAEITRRLIEEDGFDCVAVEADWPDAYRVNRFVARMSDDMDADEALSDFERFPTWMWRNAEVKAFIEWLRNFNERERARKTINGYAGFFGLDLYSMTTSIQAVLAYLDKIDPSEARAARTRYACFGQFINDPQAY